MKIHKDDNVVIISGKYRTKQGKVLRVFTSNKTVLVDGITRKKHKRTRSQGKKGEIIEVPFPINVAAVKLLCPKCGKGARVGYEFVDKKKHRVCKKCHSSIN